MSIFPNTGDTGDHGGCYGLGAIERKMQKLREALDSIMWKTEFEHKSACLTDPDLIPEINAVAREALGNTVYPKENWNHVQDLERNLDLSVAHNGLERALKAYAKARYELSDDSLVWERVRKEVFNRALLVVKEAYSLLQGDLSHDNVAQAKRCLKNGLGDENESSH